jgi:hypothetical protein
MNDESIDIEKLVHDYLSRFHSHYKVPRHFKEESQLKEWCTDNLGKEYKDWSFYKGHVNDSHCVLHIKDPKWCLVFELKWAHLIIGTLDIKK